MNTIQPHELAATQLNEVGALACDIHRRLYDPTAPEWDATPVASQDKIKYAVQVFARSGGPLTKHSLPIENAAQLALLQWQVQNKILRPQQTDAQAAMITLGFDEEVELPTQAQVDAPTDPPSGGDAPPHGEGDGLAESETPPAA